MPVGHDGTDRGQSQDRVPQAPRGRGVSRKDRNRPWVLSVRENMTTRLRIRRAAAREGLGPSEWVRLRLGEALDAAEGIGAKPFAGNGIGAEPNSFGPVSNGSTSTTQERAGKDLS
jgi:hypothetical protein